MPETAADRDAVGLEARLHVQQDTRDQAIQPSLAPDPAARTSRARTHRCDRLGGQNRVYYVSLRDGASEARGLAGSDAWKTGRPFLSC